MKNQSNRQYWQRLIKQAKGGKDRSRAKIQKKRVKR